MFQAVLDQRRRDGTPHVTSNSYGFVGVPSCDQFPTHEIWDLDHPLHRKVREVIASGAPAFFAAGNCGENCPSGKCQPTGIGPGHSIHASNSLAEVITIRRREQPPRADRLLVAGAWGCSSARSRISRATRTCSATSGRDGRAEM